MTARLGAAALVASTHYASFFLSLETLSLSLITLISYLRGQDRPLEAGVKCLILSGVSSAFLLFGIAILYPGLVAYAIMTLGAFAVIALLPLPDATRDADLVDDYRGLFWRRPALSLAFAAALLSLARIPLTVGFIANHRPGHLPGTASDPDPRDRLHGGALTAGGLQIFHGLR